MDTKLIPLSELEADAEAVLRRCYESGEALLVELPGRGLLSIQPVEPDDDLVDDLIENNAEFRAMLGKSLASPREPFPFVTTESDEANE